MLAHPQRRGELGDGVLLDHERALAGEPQLALATEAGVTVAQRPAGERLRHVGIHRTDLTTQQVAATHPVQVRPVRHTLELLRGSEVGRAAPVGDEGERLAGVQVQHLDAHLSARRDGEGCC